MPHNWKGRRKNKKGKKVAPCQGPYTPNGVSRQHPEFPKKPHNFPQQKYDSLFQKYCRIKEIKGRYRPGIIDEKRVARRDKRLNAIIEMVTMSNDDSLALRQEKNMTDDKGNLLRGIDIWSGEVYKEIKSPFDNSFVTSQFDS